MDMCSDAYDEFEDDEFEDEWDDPDDFLEDEEEWDGDEVYDDDDDDEWDDPDCI